MKPCKLVAATADLRCNSAATALKKERLPTATPTGKGRSSDGEEGQEEGGGGGLTSGSSKNSPTVAKRSSSQHLASVGLLLCCLPCRPCPPHSAALPPTRHPERETVEIRRWFKKKMSAGDGFRIWGLTCFLKRTIQEPPVGHASHIGSTPSRNTAAHDRDIVRHEASWCVECKSLQQFEYRGVEEGGEYRGSGTYGGGGWVLRARCTCSRTPRPCGTTPGS